MSSYPSLPAQQLMPGSGNPYQSSSSAFIGKGIAQTNLIHASRGGAKKRKKSRKMSFKSLVKRLSSKKKRRSKKRKYRGGDIKIQPIHGALFNHSGYQNMATSQASSYIGSRVQATNDFKVGQPGTTIHV
jgi:hypothetical protein